MIFLQLSFSSDFFRSAVLVILFEHNNEIFTILTKRSERLSSHPGDVCLPGGKEDFPGEDSIKIALRETQEEIGLPSDLFTILGMLIPLQTRNNILVQPIVALLKDPSLAKIILNKDEVSDIFACPLKIFLELSIDSCSSSKDLFMHNFLYHPNLHSSFLPQLFSSTKTFNIFGLTGVVAITTAVICFNQSATYDKLLYLIDRPLNGAVGSLKPNPKF